MNRRFTDMYRWGLRWWRTRTLAAQLVLTNLGVVGLWAVTTRQVMLLQDGARDAAEHAAARAGSAVLVTEQIDPALASLATGERGFSLTGDSAFLVPYRTGQAQLESALDTLSKLAVGNDELARATSRVERATREWGDVA